MRINHDKTIEGFEAHIRRTGGALAEWCVGTAKDARGTFFRRHLAGDLGDGLTYREAYTTSAADAVVKHFVNDRGLHADHESAGEPGELVFVYHPAKVLPEAAVTARHV